MGSQLGIILSEVLQFVRWGGLIILTIVILGIFISEAARSRLSPGRILVVAATGILAAVIFWLLPTLVNYARVDSNSIVPDHPVGSYQ
ncbi:hypothetical protein [Nocardia mexicana]|uniref:Uncharacterized protein n=1 Tax=Nocardia mexicana TaxID=279262 RepID=A0A370HC99_9NOCA|nr:hypothetical protein [Nocardia mexicana]RDI54566.1 hypothetical protein DFR68_102694 [Nocardia mexicana]